MTARRSDSTYDVPLGNLAGASEAAAAPEPGLLLICVSGQPSQAAIQLGTEPLEVGRGQGILAEHADVMMSRRHAQVAFRDGLFEIADLGSRNGSAIDGVALHGAAKIPANKLLRLGYSLFLCCPDLRPFLQFGVRIDGHRVKGPSLQQTFRAVAHIGQASRTLFISGDSGTGKESLANAFHEASPQREGPFVAINCAAVPEGVAERLLFGARKGAFSGAASDSEGYLEAAHGGTLFLDEIADLDSVVQAKLLRVIESGELLPLGATRPRKVQFSVCSATHKDLRLLVEEGQFRADLYFRIGMPQVSVPPLRQRKEEIPWLVAKSVQAVTPGLLVDVSLMESCLLRDWPGNVRELHAELSTAALTARAAGKTTVGAEHLRPGAGAALQRGASRDPAKATPAPALPTTAMTAMSPVKSVAPRKARLPAAHAARPDAHAAAPPPDAELPSKIQILAALIVSRGNVAAAARAIRVHRTQLRRLLVRYSIDPRKMRELEKP